jgi:phosphoadenosine phosphosulfate reductase
VTPDPPRCGEELRRLAEQGAREVGPHASAEQTLEWTARVFGDRFVVASSMQDAVLVHLASRVRPGVDVLFVDTGYHFAETIGTRDAIAATYPVRVVDARARAGVADQEAAEGPDLYARDPDRCCRLRKVEPLRRALGGYRAWVTGVRRAEARTRAGTPLITFDRAHGLVKVNPLANWTDEEVGAYIAEHAIVVNPLVTDGYPSIGCAPCTAKPAPGAHPRSGRWPGRAKTECGLHA